MENVFSTGAARAVVDLIRFHAVDNEFLFSAVANIIQRQFRAEGKEQMADFIASIYGKLPAFEQQEKV